MSRHQERRATASADAQQASTGGVGRGVREAKIVARASVSSVVATALDGLAYQGVLFAVASYTLAGLAGAALGAVTNFLLNRYWAFPRTTRSIWIEAAKYVLASAMTYIALQTSLFVLIDILDVHERVAWVPAKVLSWALVSYPLQRCFVFSASRRRCVTGRPNTR
jgi:putative flippase GtrA